MAAPLRSLPPGGATLSVSRPIITEQRRMTDGEEQMELRRGEKNADGRSRVGHMHAEEPMSVEDEERRSARPTAEPPSATIEPVSAVLALVRVRGDQDVASYEAF